MLVIKDKCDSDVFFCSILLLFDVSNGALKEWQHSEMDSVLEMLLSQTVSSHFNTRRHIFFYNDNNNCLLAKQTSFIKVIIYLHNPEKQKP